MRKDSEDFSDFSYCFVNFCGKEVYKNAGKVVLKVVCGVSHCVVVAAGFVHEFVEFFEDFRGGIFWFSGIGCSFFVT